MCSGTTSANLAYSNPSGSPDQYRIDYNAAAEANGFVDVPLTSLGATPIVLVVPAGAPPNSYNGHCMCETQSQDVKPPSLATLSG